MKPLSLRRPLPALVVLLMCFARALLGVAQTGDEYFASPGRADAHITARSLLLSNRVLAVSWSISKGSFTGTKLFNRTSAVEIPLPQDPFLIVLKDRASIRASEMRIVDGPRVEKLHANVNASRLADRLSGKTVAIRLVDQEGLLTVEWRATMRDDSAYVRQEVAVSAIARDLPISEIRLFDGYVAGSSVAGTVKGSPVIAGDAFLGFENPLAECRAGAKVICGMQRALPLKQGQVVRYSFVFGVSPSGQMRRGFLSYLESERAHPYRTFLHYNSWYDIGYGKPFDAAAVADVIRAFGTELVGKRGVKMDSFLLDDGWDDPRSLWSFNSGFPRGLAPLSSDAKQFGARLGIWLSPWGGYNKAKQIRLEYGTKEGFEANANGFALSGTKYFARFRDVTRKFIEEDGINQFKIDGTGNVNSVVPDSQFDSDFAAAISLIQDWRRWRPDIYVNLTTGTYPSPFWLQYADSVWRSGEDHSFAGVGNWRERWISYRDAATWQGIVQAGPLFPLSSVMLHGVIFARQAEHLDTDPDGDFVKEVHSYFGSGTQLQELYISHGLMTTKNWDLLAEAAKWSRRNADVLRDTHWVGGDPGKLEVYGWASWSRREGILTLRNPSDQVQSIELDATKIFELPADAPHKYCGRSPWFADRVQQSTTLSAGEPHRFALRPFEVLTLELTPCR